MLEQWDVGGAVCCPCWSAVGVGVSCWSKGRRRCLVSLLWALVFLPVLDRERRRCWSSVRAKDARCGSKGLVVEAVGASGVEAVGASGVGAEGAVRVGEVAAVCVGAVCWR